MESTFSITCSQESLICPHSEPDQSRPNHPKPHKNKIQSLTSCYFLRRIWFCCSLCMVRLHLNCYKQRCVITIVTNTMLYICNPSPINQTKYGAWQVLRHIATDQTRPEQSNGQDSNCSRPQSKWSNTVAESSPVLHFSAWTSVLWQ
jgi:hypothetical protein